MRFTGQSGLDLLLGLLVLLIVLNVFSMVLVRFEDVHKEISIRQQLRENINLMTIFTSFAANNFHDIHVYPQTNAASVLFGTDLPTRLNFYSRSTGTVNLEKVRSFAVQSDIPCTFAWDLNINLLNFSLRVMAADSGLLYDVDVNRRINFREKFDNTHFFVPVGCIDTFSIEGKP